MIKKEKFLTTTEGRYWVDGYMVLGSNFKTYSISFLNIGVMFCWGSVTVMRECRVIHYVKFYKLI